MDPMEYQLMKITDAIRANPKLLDVVNQEYFRGLDEAKGPNPTAQAMRMALVAAMTGHGMPPRR